MCAHKKMKKYWILLLAITSVLAGSCVSDQEVVYNDYCYIQGVTLGSVKRETHMLDSVGKDTTIRSTYTGSNFGMTIDQRTLLIENKDSLLYGSNLDAILVDITFTGASLFYRTKEDVDTVWTTYSSADSMDLRKPIELMLVSNDGYSTRTYTLKLNVHQVEGDSLYWIKDGDAVPQLQGLSQQQAFMLQGRLAVLAKKGDAVILVEHSAEGVWNESATNLPAETKVETLVKQGIALFVSTTEGDFYFAVDGKTWQKMNVTQYPGFVLTGATPDYLYALKDGELFRCDMNEQGDWIFQLETLDESPVYLPSVGIKTVLMELSDDSRRLVMVGNRSEESDNTSVVWSKMWDEDIPEGEAAWMFFNQTEENKCVLPQLEYLNLIQYDDKCMAFGGASVTGKGTHKAMDALYISQDYGITWNKDSELHLPKALKGVNGPISSVVDDNNVIWIIANGEVWRGKLNRLDFERQ